jgi:hypothetical protein
VDAAIRALILIVALHWKVPQSCRVRSERALCQRTLGLGLIAIFKFSVFLTSEH